MRLRGKELESERDRERARERPWRYKIAHNHISYRRGWGAASRA